MGKFKGIIFVLAMFFCQNQVCYAAFPVNSIVLHNNNTLGYAVTSGSSLLGEDKPMENKQHHKIKTKKRWLAIVLCLLFGAIGVHRFYLGYLDEGVLYCLWLIPASILFFTGGAVLPSVVFVGLEYASYVLAGLAAIRLIIDLFRLILGNKTRGLQPKYGKWK